MDRRLSEKAEYEIRQISRRKCRVYCEGRLIAKQRLFEVTNRGISVRFLACWLLRRRRRRHLLLARCEKVFDSKKAFSDKQRRGRRRKFLISVGGTLAVCLHKKAPLLFPLPKFFASSFVFEALVTKRRKEKKEGYSPERKLIKGGRRGRGCPLSAFTGLSAKVLFGEKYQSGAGGAKNICRQQILLFSVDAESRSAFGSWHPILPFVFREIRGLGKTKLSPRSERDRNLNRPSPPPSSVFSKDIVWVGAGRKRQ